MCIVTGRLSVERKQVGLNEILVAVTKRFSCEEQELLIVRRGVGVDKAARALAIKLCQEYGSMKFRAMGEIIWCWK